MGRQAFDVVGGRPEHHESVVREVVRAAHLRRVGIAIGSLVAASLIIGMIGGAFPPFFGVPFHPLDSGTTTTGSAIGGLVTFVLGGLIYRDIIRRERPTR